MSFQIDKEVEEKLDAMFQTYTDDFKQLVSEHEKGNKAAADDLRAKLEKMDTDIADEIKKVQEKGKEHAVAMKKQAARLLELEQKGVTTGTPAENLPGAGAFASIGQKVLESDTYKRAKEQGFPNKQIPAVEIGNPFPRPEATAIVNAEGQNQPLVQEDRVAGIFIDPAQRRFTIRDLIPTMQTDSNLVEFVKEDVFDDQAAIQGAGSSPQVYENVAKAESGITFTLESEKVHTVAHWIPASRQVLDDASLLRGHIDQRLLYGLKLEEELQLLTGSGIGANLNGLITQAPAYDAGLDVANDTKIDKLRHAILQVVRDGEYMADGIVLNHKDWHDIELVKVNAGTDDRYVWANPANQQMPRLWGLPVVPTNSMTLGDFLVGAFQLAATIWDRMMATIEVAREHDDFFIKNMVAILIEERLCLTVYRPKALVTGSF